MCEICLFDFVVLTDPGSEVFSQLNLYGKSNEECCMRVFVFGVMFHLNFLTYCFVNPN